MIYTFVKGVAVSLCPGKCSCSNGHIFTRVYLGKNDHFFEWTYVNVNVCVCVGCVVHVCAYVCVRASSLCGLNHHEKGTDHDHLGAGYWQLPQGNVFLLTCEQLLKVSYPRLLLLCEQVVNTYTPGKKIWLEGVVTTSAGGTNNLSDSYAAGFL